MSKQKQIKKQESIDDEEEIGNKIVKKRITETSSINEKTITTSSETTMTKEYAKKHSLNDIKNLKKDQEQIMLNIEKINIQNHVQEMLKHFNPPKCSNCNNRTADRVCVNKTCKRNNFMLLICGKCHFKEHQDSVIKPEIDVEEFFIKLATFLNEQKYKKKTSFQNLNSNTEGLTKSLDDINRLRQRLNDLKEQLKIEVEDYQRPDEMHSNLSNSITKALSLCEYDNVQEQLNLIKKSVFFNGNSFAWNDCHEKHKNINGLIEKLENNTTDISKSINKSLSASGLAIDLSDVGVIRSDILSYSTGYGISTKLIDNELFFTNNLTPLQSQVYLNYKFDKTCKYKIRFRFEIQPTLYVIVGLTPLSKAHDWVFNFQSHFCKIFNSPNPTLDCSRIIKGQDNRNLFNKGDQFEMRIDFENYYMDVYDYPEMKNINANQLDNNKLPDESFVLAVAMHNSQRIVLESIQEIDEIIDDQ